ncbi:uncharacterized protein LOC134865754 isoform X2 [Eleginops maclovinus]|uniref:uncharacterized protein LOC134865754 isoform X2 n=1 Tax=Eleginops maclovinus TaxID=56733 RepID=UPI003080D130
MNCFHGPRVSSSYRSWSAVSQLHRTEQGLSAAQDMQQAFKFRVLIHHEIKKITFQNGVPSSVEDLIEVFKQAFSISTEIGLLYKDTDFDDFFTLTSTSDLKDKDTLKVVHVPPGIKMTKVPQGPKHEPSDMSPVYDLPSVDSRDPVIPSPPASDRRNLWPAVFPIPIFSYNTEMALQQGNEKFLKDGTLLTSQCVKSDILERLAEAMFSYTAYPNDPQRTAVAHALIDRHPCLREPGSYNGCDGWQQSLKYKCANYRSKLKAHGNPELMINTLKHKQEGDRKPAKNIKKPRKSEVNYYPPHPAGETEDSLENMRLELISASESRDSSPMINDMMSRTYSCRRREVVGESMQVARFKERWPALFSPLQINEEFRRCNTIPLESTFMSQLDRFTSKFLELFSSKGGAVGQRMKGMMAELSQGHHVSVVKRRDVTLRCLIEYLGESVQDLISDYFRTAEEKVHQDHQGMTSRSMSVYVCQQPDAVGIIIAGTPVMTDLDNLPRACCLLLGLTYALNLDYPPKLAKTFEVFQRLFVGLDMLQPKPTSKFISLKNKLFT